MITTPPTKTLIGGRPVGGCVPSSNILTPWRPLVHREVSSTGVKTESCMLTIHSEQETAGMRQEEQATIVAERTRVFIVDDHPIVRQGLTQMINQEADLTVCGEC